jgi:hypothetical protein
MINVFVVFSALVSFSFALLYFPYHLLCLVSLLICSCGVGRRLELRSWCGLRRGALCCSLERASPPRPPSRCDFGGLFWLVCLSVCLVCLFRSVCLVSLSCTFVQSLASCAGLPRTARRLDQDGWGKCATQHDILDVSKERTASFQKNKFENRTLFTPPVQRSCRVRLFSILASIAL